jgi:hypothetical protein
MLPYRLNARKARRDESEAGFVILMHKHPHNNAPLTRLLEFYNMKN